MKTNTKTFLVAYLPSSIATAVGLIQLLLRPVLAIKIFLYTTSPLTFKTSIVPAIVFAVNMLDEEMSYAIADGLPMYKVELRTDTLGVNISIVFTVVYND